MTTALFGKFEHTTTIRPAESGSAHRTSTCKHQSVVEVPDQCLGLAADRSLRRWGAISRGDPWVAPQIDTAGVVLRLNAATGGDGIAGTG